MSGAKRAFMVATSVAAAGLLWCSAVLAAEPQLPGATIESVIAMARRLSPEIAAAALDADEAAYKIGTAGVLADPTVRLEAWDVNGQQGIGQRRFGVEQEFKLWGKRDLERGVARADADASRHQKSAVETALFSRLGTVYAEYYAAHEALRLSLELKSHAEEIASLLRARYGASSEGRQNVLKAEIEAGAAEGDSIRRQGELKSMVARLNALIGRGPLAPLAPSRGFRPLKPNLTLSGIQASARAHNPLLAASEAAFASAKNAKALADLNYYPDLTLGATFVERPRGIGDSGEFMIGLKVPLQYEAKDAEQRAAGAKLSASEARIEAVRIKLDGDVAEVWFGFEAIRKTIAIFTSRQLPQARQSVETARSGFDSGTVEVQTLLDAQRQLRTVELELLKLKVEEQAKYAELERLAGGSL